MELTTTQNGDTAIIGLTGRFDAFEVDEFRTVLETLHENKVHTIAVDLSGVVFIDSTGLAELVRGMKRCRTVGGDLTLSAPSNPVQVILELTRLDAAFEITAPAPTR